MIKYISIYELVLYSYAFGICSGLMLVAFIIYRKGNKNVHNRSRTCFSCASLRSYVNNIYKRLVE